MNEREALIANLETRITVYQARGALWDLYRRDCEIMISRLRAGLDLTDHQRGIPSRCTCATRAVGEGCPVCHATVTE